MNQKSATTLAWQYAGTSHQSCWRRHASPPFAACAETTKIQAHAADKNQASEAGLR